MCGRFALYSAYPKLSQALRLPLEPGELTPRYNVAPGVWITAVRHPHRAGPQRGGGGPLAHAPGPGCQEPGDLSRSPPDRPRDDPSCRPSSARRADHPLAREHAGQSAGQRQREPDRPCIVSPFLIYPFDYRGHSLPVKDIIRLGLRIIRHRMTLLQSYYQSAHHL